MPPSSKREKKRDSKKAKKRRSELASLERKATFIGIDLAWSARNSTGCAIIQNQRLIAYSGSLGSDQEILAFIRSHLEDECPAVIGIDAPLRVLNEEGSRLCDRTLSADWRQFEAGALPANRKIFAKMNPSKKGKVLKMQGAQTDSDDADEADLIETVHNPVRGEALVALLTDRLRFSEAASIPKRTNDRLICEIYPHPAHISLFGLEKTLKYKGRSRRTNADRWPEFEEYQRHLRSLRNAKPALKRTKALLTKTDVRKLRGKALKEYEDILDAITCAYVACYLWTYGPRFARTYGSLSDGHIIVPMTKAMTKRL